LFVPKHWWHYVECIDTAISINTWVEQVCTNIIITQHIVAHVLRSHIWDKEKVALFRQMTEQEKVTIIYG
jgi:HSPB1-associated protein 1